VRTYSVSNGLDLVPQLASEYGLRVTLGVWINDWEEQNEREIETAITLAKHYRNVESIIVGNETISGRKPSTAINPTYNANRTRARPHRQDPAREARSLGIRSPPPRCRMSGSNIRSLPRRSTTSPCISSLLGGTAGFGRGRPCAHAYEKLRQTYPGKRIVIAEFGWPSAGLNRKDACRAR
jgi:hypothetical protein